MGQKDDKDRRPADDYRTVHRLPVNLSRKWTAGSHITSFPTVFGTREWATIIVEYPDGRMTLALVTPPKKEKTDK